MAPRPAATSISAVLPAYNEEAIIERMVRHVAGVLSGLVKEFDVAELADFLPAMDGHTDLVIGWRRNRADSGMRLLNANGWKLLVNGLFGYTARDVDCAFKLFRRRVWESLTVHARGATFSAEFLIKARRLGFRVKELPVGHFPRTAGSPTGARPHVIVRAFVELFRLWRNLESDVSADPR